MSREPERTDPEEQALERETRGSSLTGYALIKYSSMVIIMLAVLYFVAVYLLPSLGAAQ